MKALARELKRELNPEHVEIILVKSKYGEYGNTQHIVFKPKGEYGEGTLKAVEKRLKLEEIPVNQAITGEIWLSAADYDETLNGYAPKERERVKKQLAQEIKQSKRIRKLYDELLKLKFKEKFFED